MKRLLLALTALIFVVSCAKDGAQKGGYVAKIDGKTITKEDVQAEMSALPDMAKAFFTGPEGTARFVDELVKKELLYTEAMKKGLDKDKNYQRKLEDFKKLTLINQLLDKEMESVGKVTDKDVKEYYDKHKDEMIMSSQVRLSHIVVKSEDEAKKAYERLQKGEDFAKVAAEMSQDKATSKTGGDIGTFKRGDMAPQLEEVAFRLKKGEISMPVALKDGIHILKATDVKGTAVDFEKAKGAIGQRIMAEKQRAAFDTLIEKLKKASKVEINKQALADLNTAPAAPAQPHPPIPAQPKK